MWSNAVMSTPAWSNGGGIGPLRVFASPRVVLFLWPSIARAQIGCPVDYAVNLRLIEVLRDCSSDAWPPDEDRRDSRPRE
jgi:hypothetical protein